MSRSSRAISRALVWRGWGIGVLALVLGGCALAPRSEPPAPAAEGVELRRGGLVATAAGRPELSLTLANVSARLLWVSVHFQTPGGGGDCVVARELPPQESAVFSCPQRSIRPDADYPVQVAAFADPDQAAPLHTVATVFRFDAGDVAALQAPPGR